MEDTRVLLTNGNIKSKKLIHRIVDIPNPNKPQVNTKIVIRKTTMSIILNG